MDRPRTATTFLARDACQGVGGIVADRARQTMTRSRTVGLPARPRADLPRAWARGQALPTRFASAPPPHARAPAIGPLGKGRVAWPAPAISSPFVEKQPPHGSARTFFRDSPIGVVRRGDPRSASDRGSMVLAQRWARYDWLGRHDPPLHPDVADSRVKRPPEGRAAGTSTVIALRLVASQRVSVSGPRRRATGARQKPSDPSSGLPGPATIPTLRLLRRPGHPPSLPLISPKRVVIGGEPLFAAPRRRHSTSTGPDPPARNHDSRASPMPEAPRPLP